MTGSYSSFTLSWNEPETTQLITGEFIKTYDIQMISKHVQEFLQSDDRQVEFFGLKPGTMVIIAVRAKCSCGQSGLQGILLYNSSEWVTVHSCAKSMCIYLSLYFHACILFGCKSSIFLGKNHSAIDWVKKACC